MERASEPSGISTEALCPCSSSTAGFRKPNMFVTQYAAPPTRHNAKIPAMMPGMMDCFGRM